MSRDNFGKPRCPFAIWPPQALSQLLLSLLVGERLFKRGTLQSSSRARPHGLRLAAELERKKIFDLTKLALNVKFGASHAC